MKKKNKILMGVSIYFIILLLAACGTTVKKSGETFTDSRDGTIYKIVKIGSQTWMAENLAYKTNNGCWAYDDNESNVATYGYLYNWETAKTVCPKGWHLPSDKEFQTLIDHLGGDSIAGSKLKETGTTHWDKTNIDATNESGFSALPGGIHFSTGKSKYIGEVGHWWSSSEFGIDRAWERSLINVNSVASRFNPEKELGFSVRCIKDSL